MLTAAEFQEELAVLGLSGRRFEPEDYSDALREYLNMSATTVPWPQINEARQCGVVQLSNLSYCLLLPLIVIDSVFVLVRRPASCRSSGR